MGLLPVALPQLVSRHIVVLPDIIANAGGIIMSYLKWRQNLAGEHWDEEKVNNHLAEILLPATTDMFERAATQTVPFKHAASGIALERLLS